MGVGLGLGVLMLRCWVVVVERVVLMLRCWVFVVGRVIVEEVPSVRLTVPVVLVLVEIDATNDEEGPRALQRRGLRFLKATSLWSRRA